MLGEIFVAEGLMVSDCTPSAASCALSLWLASNSSRRLTGSGRSWGSSTAGRSRCYCNTSSSSSMPNAMLDVARYQRVHVPLDISLSLNVHRSVCGTGENCNLSSCSISHVSPTKISWRTLLQRCIFYVPRPYRLASLICVVHDDILFYNPSESVYCSIASPNASPEIHSNVINGLQLVNCQSQRLISIEIIQHTLHNVSVSVISPSITISAKSL